MSTLPPESPGQMTSPPWPRSAKLIIVITVLVLMALLVWRFQSLVGMIVVAALLAYLLNPLIVFLSTKSHMPRWTAVALVYFGLAILIIVGFSALGVAGFQQGVNLIQQAPTLVESITELISEFVGRTEPMTIGPFQIAPTSIPWETISQQIVGLVEPVLSQSAVAASRLATLTVRTVINVVFVFFVSIYLASDLLNMGSYFTRLADQPGYREDAIRLMAELKLVWGAYLRGQILLGLVIFAMVWIALTLLGVQNSLALGILSGFLEFVPTIGPVISAIVAIIVAFFQPENYFNLAPWVYALIVLGVMILIQQIENTLLVPRIVGGALNLHPFIVIVGVFMGASLAGVLGAVLAAPIIASLKVLGGYTWRKLFDLPPFPDRPPPAVLAAEAELVQASRVAATSAPSDDTLPPTSDAP
jgi:predicted PurR-regulated permease PerM